MPGRIGPNHPAEAGELCCGIRHSRLFRRSVPQMDAQIPQMCSTYRHYATRILFKWLNRKSQRRTYTWEGYLQALRWIGWPKIYIRKDLNPHRGLETI